MAIEDWIDEGDLLFPSPRMVTCRNCGVGNLVWEVSVRTGKYYLATLSGNKHQCKQKNINREVDKFFKGPNDE